MGNDPKPEGPEIDRAMIPKVPRYDKKSAAVGAHRTLARGPPTNPRSPGTPDTAAHLPFRG
jgi:hypothetical protein